MQRGERRSTGRSEGYATGARATSNRVVGCLRSATAPLRIGVAGSRHERDADRAVDGVLGTPRVYSCWPQSPRAPDHQQEQPITDFMSEGLGGRTIWMYRPAWG